MVQLPTAVVGDAYTSDFALSVLEDLVEIENRMAGQEGEREGAQVIKAAFEDADLRDASITEFEIPGWWRGSSALGLPDRGKRYDGSHQVIALPGTPAADVSAPIVDLGYGLPEDFEEADLEGKLAMASSDVPDDYDRWIHRGEKYGMAVNHGAAGFIFRNHIEGCLPPTGSIGGDGPGAIPAIGLSKELGDRLARYADDGEFDAHLDIDCRNEDTHSRNVEAVIGPDTDEEVLVTAHVDAHDIAEGANDNGTGSALVCEVGRLLKQVEDDLETRVRVMTFGAEEVGLYGAYEWADTHDLENMKCIINIDGAGYSRNLEVYTHTFDPIGEAFKATSDDLGIPIVVDDGIRPHSDHWPFVQKGAAGAQARSSSEGSGRGWGHTHGDTLDKLDIRDIRELAVGLADGALKLTTDAYSVEHKDPQAIAEAIEPEAEEGMRATDSWPFDA
ncbi:MAG: M28 family peptidase [Halobacteriales archaeon]